MSSSKPKKSMNPLIFCPKIIDIQPKYVSWDRFGPISWHPKINCAKLFSRINTLRSALKDLLFWIRHVFMISNRIVGADFDFFRFFVFFHEFRIFSLEKQRYSWCVHLQYRLWHVWFLMKICEIHEKKRNIEKKRNRLRHFY